MSEWRASEAELIWHSDKPDGVVERVRADMENDLRDLECAEDLIFHTVFLGDDMETCPCVIVWGKDGEDALHCEYHHASEMQTLREVILE
jgi:hypothetical protein